MFLLEPLLFAEPPHCTRFIWVMATELSSKNHWKSKQQNLFCSCWLQLIYQTHFTFLCYWLCHRKISLRNFKNYFWISRTGNRILYERKMTLGNSTEFQVHHELRVRLPSFPSWRKFCSSGNPHLKAIEQETVAQVGEHASHPALSPPVKESGWEFLPNCCREA